MLTIEKTTLIGDEDPLFRILLLSFCQTSTLSKSTSIEIDAKHSVRNNVSDLLHHDESSSVVDSITYSCNTSKSHDTKEDDLSQYDNEFPDKGKLNQCGLVAGVQSSEKYPMADT